MRAVSVEDVFPDESFEIGLADDKVGRARRHLAYESLKFALDLKRQSRPWRILSLGMAYCGGLLLANGVDLKFFFGSIPNQVKLNRSKN